MSFETYRVPVAPPLGRIDSSKSGLDEGYVESRAGARARSLLARAAVPVKSGILSRAFRVPGDLAYRVLCERSNADPKSEIH